MTERPLTRRRVLQVLVVGGGAVVPLLAACGAIGPVAPTVAPSAGGPIPPTVVPSTAGSTPPAAVANALPTFIPNTSGPAPDFPAPGPQYEDGFITYPKNPVKALPPTPPGAGSKVLCYTNNSAPAPPTPFDQNQAWQADQQRAQRRRAVHDHRPGRLPREAGDGDGRQRPARHHAHRRGHPQRRRSGPEPDAVPGCQVR